MRHTSLDAALKSVLENGYEIAASRGLIGLKKKIYKNSESGFKATDNNFGHMVAQEWRAQDYETWYKSLEDVFIQFGLQIAKFKIKADSFDPSSQSNHSAQRFIRRIYELEKLTEDKTYLQSYVKTSINPPVTLVKNVLSQGKNTHEFEDEYARTLRLLWKNRAIVNSKKDMIREPIPLTRSMVYSQLKIDHEALVRIAKGIKAINTKKNIAVQIVYPKNGGVNLVVTQDIG